MSVIDLSQVRKTPEPAKPVETFTDAQIANVAMGMVIRYTTALNERNVAFKDLVEAASGPLRNIQVAPGTPHPLAEKQSAVKAYEASMAFMRDVLGAAATIKQLADKPELGKYVPSYADDLVAVRKTIATALDRDPRTIMQDEAMVLSSIAELGAQLEFLSKF